MLATSIALPTPLAAISPALLHHMHETHYQAPHSTLAPAQRIKGAEKTYSGSKIDVLTFHYDNDRTGWNPAETDLTPASLASGKFGLLATLPVDDTVLAQPLIVSNFIMPDGSMHDLLIVATEGNSVYAFDANSFAVLWHVNLGPPQSAVDVNCNNIAPNWGISGTPVIIRTEPNGGVIYLVSSTEPAPRSFATHLHGLSLATGADLFAPRNIAVSATLRNGATVYQDQLNQYNRTGLATSGAYVYFGIGSRCDNGGSTDSGWLLRYTTFGIEPAGQFNTILYPTSIPDNIELASIWMSGFAPAIDDRNRVFVATGNGDVARTPNSRAKDWGESVLALRPDLKSVMSAFTPSDWSELNAMDIDVGSGGVVLVPRTAGQKAPPMALAIGKSGLMYLLDTNHLGGLQPYDKGVLQASPIADSLSGAWGGAAYWRGPNGPQFFVQCQSGYLLAFNLNTGSPPGFTSGPRGYIPAGFEGAQPTISSNASTAGTGIVWVIRHASPLELEAYDAASLGNPIYAAQAGTWSNSLMNALITPVVANGHVYATAYKTVSVFGLVQ